MHRRHDYAQEGVQLLAVEGAIVGLPAVRGVAGLEVQVKPLVAMLLAQSRVGGKFVWVVRLCICPFMG